MTNFVHYALPGIPSGCEYALMAVGLVLTFRATGVFNLAFGAQAFVSAFVFDLVNQYGFFGLGPLNQWVAFVIAVLVVAPLIGLALDRFLYRHIPAASTTAKLVVSLGLLVAIPQLIPIVFSDSSRQRIGFLWLNPDTVYFHLFGVPFNGGDVSTTVLAVAVVVLLMAMFRWTGIGLQMRAVVESRRLSQLQGVDAPRVAAAAWALSSILAGLSGVLLLPQQHPLDPTNPLQFTTLLVAGITAAVIAGLSSIPVAFLAAVGIGVLQNILQLVLPTNSVWASGLRTALPFALLAAVLLLNRNLRTLEQSRDPMAAVDPPPPVPAAQLRDRRLDVPVRWGLRVAILAFFVSCLTWVAPNWVFALGGGVILSIIFLSITLLTGMSGQVSLCQMTFAGVGAFTAGQLASAHGIPVLLGVAVGGALAAVVGAVIAVIAVRISGLALTLFTLAFALFADQLLFQFSWSGNGQEGISVPRPQIGSLDLSPGDPGDRYFLVIAAVVLALCVLVVVLVQKGTLGRYLAAMRGSPTAAAGIGINLTRAKIVVFALSAGIAGIGGGLYGSFEGTIAATNFDYVFSLVFVVVVITTGSTRVEGAVYAGMSVAVLQQILDNPMFKRISGIEFVLFAVGALTYAQHPEGVVEYLKTKGLNRLSHLLERWDYRHGNEPLRMDSATAVAASAPGSTDG